MNNLRTTTRLLLPLARTTITTHRYLHTTPPDQTWPQSPTSPEPRAHPNAEGKPAPGENIGAKRFADFDLAGKVFIVTGGAQGLGLAMAEALVEAGGKVYALDRSPHPDSEWATAQSRIPPGSHGSLHYRQQDVSNPTTLTNTISSIASTRSRLDGVVAAAGVQQVTKALDYTASDVARMLEVNYTGVFMTAQAAARAMFEHGTSEGGSIVLVASMSGLVANKGLVCPVYNSSKAAVIQLARNLAMEWSPVRRKGKGKGKGGKGGEVEGGGVRVNCLSPGHVLTPMVRKNFEEVPGLREMLEGENMMGRLAETGEFKGAVLFLMSRASSFMTGGNLVIDGGHTAW
ncbi:hypothetical protein B0J18DRAFT_475689 [Chaetomium sp. MPI-SDFR-AT-0129]|nr:hypothetical protein B0J18DRAFT_475689 [Chaetomium sp. MPI-SDFR-AT-0129]